MKMLWITQILAIVRLELRKTFFAKRGLWIYLLAMLPVVIFAGHSIEMMVRNRPCDFGQDTNIFATVFQLLNLRLVFFFGCLGIFINLFRGEVLDRSLHDEARPFTRGAGRRLADWAYLPQAALPWDELEPLLELVERWVRHHRVPEGAT